MPRAGPSGGSCSTFPMTSRSLPDLARTFIRGDVTANARVLGFTLKPREEGSALQTFGAVTAATSSQTFEFTEDQEMVGYWGSQTD